MERRDRATSTRMTSNSKIALTVVGIPAASFADNPSGCDFGANGTTQSCTGPLSGSTFAGGDGYLLASPATFGSTDWQNVALTVVTGSIPPNKSDLTRFYEASEFANGSNFLHLGWERTNNLGSANLRARRRSTGPRATCSSRFPGSRPTPACLPTRSHAGVTSQADVGNSPQGPGSSVNVAVNGLKPGTYTCTITVDP